MLSKFKCNIKNQNLFLESDKFLLLSLFYINKKYELYNFINIYFPNSDLLDQFSLISDFYYFRNISVLNLNIVSDFTAIHFPFNFFEITLILSVRGFHNKYYLYFILESLYALDFFSFSFIFLSFNWLEREIYDMFGVYFLNHVQLRRILTDYGFRGYPLLKDFPVYGFKELRYDIEKQQVVYVPIRLSQSFRFYNFARQWNILVSVVSCAE